MSHVYAGALSTWFESNSKRSQERTRILGGSTEELLLWLSDHRNCRWPIRDRPLPVSADWLRGARTLTAWSIGLPDISRISSHRHQAACCCSCTCPYDTSGGVGVSQTKRGPIRAWQKKSRLARIWIKPFSKLWRLWDGCPKKIGIGLS